MKIKNKTYRNFLYVVKRIQAKGYDQEEAVRMAHRIFDEFNPLGKSVERMIDEILPYEAWVKECQLYAGSF